MSLARVYAKLYSAIHGFWYLSVKGKMSDEEALACEVWVWGKQPKYELGGLTKLLKIQGKDTIALMKALQFIP